MESQKLGGAESLIRGEAIRFMQRQRSDEQRSKWDMVVFEQSEEIPQPASSSSEPPSSETEQAEQVPEASSAEPPPSEPARNFIEEIMMKYGLKRQANPPIVIATPIPPEPTSAPPQSLMIKFKKSRKKQVARKSTGTSEPTESKQEVPIVQTEVASETQSPSQEAYVPPPLKEVKLEIEDMTAEEFERYGWTDKLSFGQMACLDAERANAKPAQVKGKGKGKSKGKGKWKTKEVEEDPNFPVWNVKIKAVHYPNGEVIPFSDATGFPRYAEVQDLKRAFEESVESERLRREKEEAELQSIIAEIDQREKDAHIAKLQKENERRQEERERKKRHRL